MKIKLTLANKMNSYLPGFFSKCASVYSVIKRTNHPQAYLLAHLLTLISGYNKEFGYWLSVMTPF